MAKKMDACIHICNQQTMDGQSETIEMDVLGALTQTQDGFLLTYTEYDEEANCCDTTVRVTGSDTVSVARSGIFSSEMLFQAGKRGSFAYGTPYGTLTMGLYTKSVENALRADGGRLRFCYSTDFQSQAPIDNRMTLTVSPK